MLSLLAFLGKFQLEKKKKKRERKGQHPHAETIVQTYIVFITFVASTINLHV